MKIRKLSDMKGGWFVGNFDPAAFRSKDVEVAYQKHKRHENHQAHYHAKATEINLLVKGRMTMQGHLLKPGDIFIFEPYEVADPHFLEDCEIVVVKTPSEPSDKYLTERPSDHPLKDLE